jgi:hypothetical protein
LELTSAGGSGGRADRGGAGQRGSDERVGTLSIPYLSFTIIDIIR